MSSASTGKLKISESKLAELATVLEFNGTETAELRALREAGHRPSVWQRRNIASKHG